MTVAEVSREGTTGTPQRSPPKKADAPAPHASTPSDQQLDNFRREVLAEAQRLALLEAGKDKVQLLDTVKAILASATSKAEVRHAQMLLISATPEEEIRARLDNLYLDKAPPIQRALESMKLQLREVAALNAVEVRTLYLKIIGLAHSDQVEQELRSSAGSRMLSLNLLIFSTSLITFVSFVWILFVSPPESADMSSVRPMVIFLTVLFSGFFGASFSVVVSLAERVRRMSSRELFESGTWWRALLRPLTGAGGAVILYFFYESEIISSDLFPDLSEIGFEKTSQGVIFNKDFGKLLFWSFLAGFSERLVPDALNRVEHDFASPRD